MKEKGPRQVCSIVHESAVDPKKKKKHTNKKKKQFIGNYLEHRLSKAQVC